MTDIRGIASIARAGGALSMVDNSMMAPVFQQPLALGADICMTSATKVIFSTRRWECMTPTSPVARGCARRTHAHGHPSIAAVALNVSPPHPIVQFIGGHSDVTAGILSVKGQVRVAQMHCSPPFLYSSHTSLFDLLLSTPRSLITPTADAGARR